MHLSTVVVENTVYSYEQKCLQKLDVIVLMTDK